MKVGDLVKENWGLERVAVVLSSIRRSTPRDNYAIGVMHEDTYPVVDIVLLDAGVKVVRDVDGLEVISESR